MKKKFIFIILLGILTLTYFTGCSSKKVKLVIETNEDEIVSGDYKKENVIGDNILEILKDVTVIKTGYSFEGWLVNGTDVKSDTVIKDKEIKLVPKFKAIDYKLVYKVNGSIYLEKVYHYKDIVESPNSPEIAGYIFKGWSNLPETMPANNLEVVAIFEANEYKVTYKVDNEIYDEKTYHTGDTLQAIEAPTKEGYTFKGWNNLPETMPANDLEVVAIFEANEYKVTYKVDNEIYDEKTYHTGDALQAIEAPTKEGYTFKGWSNLPETMPASNLEVVAIFEANEYKVTYKVDNEIYDEKTYHTGDTLQAIEAPTKEGYTFKGWSNLPETMPASNLEVVAIFEANEYKVTYKVDNEIYDEKTYHTGDTLQAIEAPTKEGYTFKGWNNLPETMPANDLEVVAIFEGNEYKVTYKVNNEVYEETTYRTGDTIVKPIDPQVDGYVFKNWNPELVETMPAHDLEYNAILETATYAITYIYDDGMWPTTNPANVDELLTALFTDFHTWLGSNSDLATFIKGADGTYKNGGWNAQKGKLYAANLTDIRENSEFFINDIKYHDKWIGFFNTLDECIKEVNPSQDLWSSTYVGCIRLYEIVDVATRFSETQKTRMIESLKIELEPRKTYQLGDEFTFMNLNLSNGREFLGWYLDGELITGITASMAKDITVVAKYTDPIFPQTITINNPVAKLDKNISYTLNITLSPDNITHGDLVYESSEPKVATIKNGVISTLGYGTTTIKVYSSYRPEVSTSMNLEVFPNITNDGPVIYLSYQAKPKFSIKIGEAYDLRQYVFAYDATDGDITANIVIDDATLDPETAGKYTVKYSVTDKDGNTYELIRDVVVVGNPELIFIGHAGCYAGIMNTEEAFINAAALKGYKAIECDVKQTSDGVFIVCHDNDFGGYALASTPYSVLKDVKVTQTRGGITYTANICTFKRYLEICKQYNVYAVVELKSSAGITNSDQSRMGALMNEIKEVGMLDKVIFLGSQYKCLEWVRNNYKDIPCQYLVNSCESETIFNRCVEWNFDVSFNIGYSNSVEWIDRYHEAGLKVSSYTFSQYSDAATLQSWIDKGVDFVTCDVLTEKDVKIPDYNQGDDLPEYKVIFKDIDGTILKETYVKQGKKAVAPFNPKKEGYEFAGWDKDISAVNNDMEVTATYKLVEYTISYDANFNLVTESSWANKQEFIDDFYNDLFAWLTSMVGKIDGLTYDGTTYTYRASSTSYGTTSFKNVSDLKAIGIYYFEQTIGTLIYKPLEGTNSPDREMEEAEGYFLNTEPYRTKYKALNAYFLNVIQTSYTSYSKTYSKNSAGKVQIFFRFQQWQQGTNIAAFNNIPKKYDVVSNTPDNVQLPTTHKSYTIEDSFVFDVPTCEGYTFVGWYLDQACTISITEVTKGTTGNLKLYAKWQAAE